MAVASSMAKDTTVGATVLRAALRLLDEPKNCLRALPGKSTVCTLQAR